MQTIWKIPLVVTDEQSVSVPWGAVALTVQMQNGKPCLWVKVNTDNQSIRRAVYIHGTGNFMPDDNPDDLQEYVGTVQDGALVWHVFWA